MESDKRTTTEYRYSSAGIEFLPTMSKKDRYFLDRAASFARKREVEYQNHCAIAVRGGKIIAISFNTYKNDPRVLSDEHVRMVPGRNAVMGVGCHAETGALNQLTETDNVVIYVARVLKDGSTANSAPCEGCTETMREAGVKRVFWTTDKTSS